MLLATLLVCSFSLSDALASIDTKIDKAALLALSSAPEAELTLIANDRTKLEVVRVNAVRGLRHLGPASLEGFAEHEDPALRQAAVQTLARYFSASSEAQRVLMARMMDADVLVRKAAMRGALRSGRLILLSAARARLQVEPNANIKRDLAKY